MKKLIFLLFPFLMLAQNPTNFPYGIKNTVAPSNSTPSYFVTQEVDGVHKKTPAANVEKTANKSDSYTTSSSTTYASTKAVVDGLATKISGTGTINTIPKFTSAGVLGNSQIFDNGSRVWIGGTDNGVDKLQVNGSALIQGQRISSDFPTNLFLGDGAGINNTPISDTQGRQNVFFGVNAGRDNTTGYANLFLGYNSGYQNATGTRNTYLGYQSGYRGVSNSFNTFVGTDAGFRNTADNNIFLGFHAGFNGGNLDNITGDKNIIIGNETAGFLNTGFSNNIIGHNAGYNITTGNSNILEGYNSGLSITTGSQNVLIGVETGQAITTGTNNVYLGFRAGFYANNSTYYNTGVGDQSLFNLTTGNLNTGVGGRSGISLLTGLYNTYIGFDAGNNALQKTDALFSTAIGYNSYNTKDNQVVIGGSYVAETIIRGNVPNLTLTGTPTAPTATVGTNTTQIATTAFVQAVDANVVHKTGEETIGLGEKYFTDNVNFTSIAVSGQAIGRAAVYPNEFVIKSQLDLKAPLSSPTFTGTPTAPTATAGTNTTQIATTAFVLANSSSGTYTPTLTNTTNITSSTLNAAYYVRNGNIITVTIAVQLTLTATADTVFTFSLPVSGATVVNGVGQGNLTSGGGSVNAYGIVDTTNSTTAQLRIGSAAVAGSGAGVANIIFTYSL